MPVGFEVRKWATYVEEIHAEGGPSPGTPLVKASTVAVVRNPCAGRWSEDLGELIGPSGELGTSLVRRATAALGVEVESMGKGAIVGVAGEQEHGVACLTTPFGDALRDGTDGTTWVTSNTKVGGPGTAIDVPLAYKRALMVRSHYDTVTVAVPDAPRPDEIVVVVALASGPRIHDRCGGLRKEEATAGDGLR